jgi:hypothetical protein
MPTPRLSNLGWSGSPLLTQTASSRQRSSRPAFEGEANCRETGPAPPPLTHLCHPRPALAVTHNTPANWRFGSLRPVKRAGHAAARVHHAPRRCGGNMAARRPRAATRSDAVDRRADESRGGGSGIIVSLTAFVQGLQQLVRDGRNVRIDYRWGRGRCRPLIKRRASLSRLSTSCRVHSPDLKREAKTSLIFS